MPLPFPLTDDRDLERLLQSMTLAEKIGQLVQAQPQGLDLADRVRSGRLGSLLNATGALAREYQRIAREESRLGIPLLLGRDVIHGYRTVFPIPLGQAASFDPDAVREAAAAAAREARVDGIDWTFSPMLDIARDPRWGRIAEGHGEDPLLTGRLGAAMVEGYQSAGLAACAKHYVGYGAVEGGRDYAQALIPERMLHDVYLPPFEAAVRAGVMTVMSAFQDLDGLPLTAHRPLLTGVLRERWGFDGLVVSDWNAVIELVVHGLAEDEADAARQALMAGVDMEMASGSYDAHLAALVADGRLEVGTIDEAVRRVLRIKHRLGLFEPAAATPVPPDLTAHDALARRLARESCVLLANRGALPADPSQRVAVVGPLADAAADQLGCWVFDGDVSRSRSVLAAMRERLGQAGVRHAPGLPDARSTDTGGIAAAVDAAREADWVLLCVGEDAALSGEAHSRAHLELPGAQQALLESLAATGRPVVVVVLSGRPLVLTPVLPHAAALLLAWHPGSQGGPAIVDLLYGAESPSGRLPVSLPRSVGQIPIHYNHHRTGRPPLADAPSIPSGTPLDPSGFYSAYLDEDHRPLFPFGHGLGYATVSYGPVSLSAPTLPVGGALQARVTLRNAGPRPALETVQLYVRDLVASVTRPVRELKDFRRVEVPPHGEATVEFVLQSEALAFHGRDGRRIVEPGRHELWLAPDAASGTPVAFDVVAG